MRKVVGYLLMALVFLISFPLRLLLPLAAIVAIVAIVLTFINFGVVAGLISIPINFIVLAVLETALGFILLPLAALSAVLLGRGQEEQVY